MREGDLRGRAKRTRSSVGKQIFYCSSSDNLLKVYDTYWFFPLRDISPVQSSSHRQPSEQAVRNGRRVAFSPFSVQSSSRLSLPTGRMEPASKEISNARNLSLIHDGRGKRRRRRRKRAIARGEGALHVVPLNLRGTKERRQGSSFWEVYTVGWDRRIRGPEDRRVRSSKERCERSGDANEVATTCFDLSLSLLSLGSSSYRTSESLPV